VSTESLAEEARRQRTKVLTEEGNGFLPGVTWTRGPEYPVVRCRRCGSHLELKDIKSGWCWVCEDMGAVEFLREGGDWTK
jgi:hypothetical protein